MGGYENIAEYREGVLLDSMLFYTKDGVIALIEQYVNCWESCYRVEMAKNGTPEASKIERYFTMKWELDYTR